MDITLTSQEKTLLPSSFSTTLRQRRRMSRPRSRSGRCATSRPQNAPRRRSLLSGTPAHVHRGACDRLRLDPHFVLTDLTLPESEYAGSRLATRVEMSYSVVDLSLEELMTVRYSITLHEDRDAHNDDLVCGEIGGVRDANGGLAIGLREVDDSGHAGIAYLSPDPADPNRTQISLFIAPELAEDPETPTAAAEP